MHSITNVVTLFQQHAKCLDERCKLLKKKLHKLKLKQTNKKPQQILFRSAHESQTKCHIVVLPLMELNHLLLTICCDYVVCKARSYNDDQNRLVRCYSFSFFFWRIAVSEFIEWVHTIN